ncbi:hypothetical protein QBC38DRAFT_445299 [Podospora fimiseda]|uniref:Uncharacterized protein n=1 Tax=Podospora fimiseda TaxID=252190 RepID=A0AAN7BLV0_9PEZI|nr:hypothetical protein QBC38DRAFT_445299 [Podospora fimiseda]
MKFSSIFALALLGASAEAVSMKACSSKDMNGSCTTKTSNGKSTGTFKSYKFTASTNKCVKICNSCDSLGWRCQSYSNNDISFNKFIVFDWANGNGPDNASCC